MSLLRFLFVVEMANVVTFACFCGTYLDARRSLHWPHCVTTYGYGQISKDMHVGYPLRLLCMQHFILMLNRFIYFSGCFSGRNFPLFLFLRTFLIYDVCCVCNENIFRYLSTNTHEPYKLFVAFF